jgi:hypothetical protein
MKGLSGIIAVFILVFGTVASRGAKVDRISAQTGVPVATLQAERTSTGLGLGELENAHLLANALAAKGSNLTFNDLVAMHRAGEGWGEIAHDNGLNLGRIVSAAHRSSKAAMHAKNTKTISTTTVHGKSTTALGKGHATMMKGIGGNSHGLGSFHGMGSVHGMGSFHGMGHMGHGH